MQDVYMVSQGWSDFMLKAKLRRQQAGPQGQTQDAILQSCFMWETAGIQIIFGGHLQSHVPTSHVTIQAPKSWDSHPVISSVFQAFKGLKTGTRLADWQPTPLRTMGCHRRPWVWSLCWAPQDRKSSHVAWKQWKQPAPSHWVGPCHFWGAGQLVCYVQGQTIDLLILEGIPPEQKQYWEHVQCTLPAASCDRSHVCCKAKVDDFHSFATWPSTTWRATCVVWKNGSIPSIKITWTWAKTHTKSHVWIFLVGWKSQFPGTGCFFRFFFNFHEIQGHDRRSATAP